MKMRLSVLMSVYKRESPLFLREALESLAIQTVRADEVVIVKDGPVGSDLDDAIASYGRKLPIMCLQLERNEGLGPALSAGVDRCNADMIARMDADDICVRDRFEKQLAFLERNPEVDVVGGAIAEFKDDSRKVESIRRMPCDPASLGRAARRRNPLNHMTVMFRKASVLAAGSYQACPGFEDYYLWARMLMRGCSLHNLPDVLVHARCGNGMQQRRGGFSYLQAETALQHKFLAMDFVSKPQFLLNLAARLPIRVAPVSLRATFYRVALRSS